MGKYRKLPVVIEAFQLGNFSRSDYEKEKFEEWAITHGLLHQQNIRQKVHWWWDWDGVHILTLEGEMVAGVSDWIAKGIEGEFYPIKNSIFVATYEAVDE